jgi:hypothetical protein
VAELKLGKEDLENIIQTAVVAAVTPDKILAAFKDVIANMFKGEYKNGYTTPSMFHSILTDVVRKAAGDYMEKMFEDSEHEFHKELKKVIDEAMTRLFVDKRDSLVSAVRDSFHRFLTRD